FSKARSLPLSDGERQQPSHSGSSASLALAELLYLFVLTHFHGRQMIPFDYEMLQKHHDPSFGRSLEILPDGCAAVYRYSGALHGARRGFAGLALRSTGSGPGALVAVDRRRQGDPDTATGFLRCLRQLQRPLAFALGERLSVKVAAS